MHSTGPALRRDLESAVVDLAARLGANSGHAFSVG